MKTETEGLSAQAKRCGFTLIELLVAYWTNPSGRYKSRSPVSSGQVSPLMLIAADVTAKIDGRWRAGRPTCYSGYPAHPNSAGRPTGGNQAYVDGSVSWKKFE